MWKEIQCTMYKCTLKPSKTSYVLYNHVPQYSTRKNQLLSVHTNVHSIHQKPVISCTIVYPNIVQAKTSYSLYNYVVNCLLQIYQRFFFYFLKKSHAAPVKLSKKIPQRSIKASTQVLKKQDTKKLSIICFRFDLDLKFKKIISTKRIHYIEKTRVI